MHWCAEETMALVASIPVIGAAWLYLKSKWRAWRQKGRKSC